MNLVEVKNLHVTVQGQEIIHGLNLTVEEGSIHALMGPNGSGKSTLAYTLLGHPKYTVTDGTILFKGEDITSLSSTERARKGLFLSFQQPRSISGVTIASFLRAALNATRKEPIAYTAFHALLQEKMKLLSIDPSFVSRYMNEGFSGGEKKQCEILQLLVLNPLVAILDETDSGLDIDALKTVSSGMNAFMSKDKGILIITHYKRILKYIKPQHVSIMKEGRIIQQGAEDLVDRLEEKGYKWLSQPDQG